MSPAFASTFIFLSLSFILRHENTVTYLFTSNGDSLHDFKISPSISNYKLPICHLCFDKKLMDIPSSSYSVKLLFLLLLAGDVASNPGPTACKRSNVVAATLNARSLKLKSASIADSIVSHSIDILAITETWTKNTDTSAAISDLTPPGYIFKHKPRPSRRGGGVGFMVACDFTVKDFTVPTFSTFECMANIVSNKSFSGLFVSIYHPDPHHSNMFFEEYQDLLEILAPLGHDIYILGDLNLHLDTDNAGTRKFNDILDSFNLKQHVDFPTHIHGHWLDVFITRAGNHNVKSIKSCPGVSDHFMVLAQLNFCKPIPGKQKIAFRHLRKIDISKLKAELSASDLIRNPKESLNELCDDYFSTLSTLLDKHAPVKHKYFSNKPSTPWMTPEILKLKIKKRRLERVWRKSRSRYDRSKYTTFNNLCNRKMSIAKDSFITDTVQESSNNPRNLWSSINKLLHRLPTPTLPDTYPEHILPEKFSSFFTDKIANIRKSFSNSLDNTDFNNFNRENISSFQPATTDEIRKIITNSNNAYCDLDPFPTALVKECLDILITPITSIINKSLQCGIFPNQYKTALVNPILKKAKLDKNDFKNYRPVSNLSFVSKILEKVVATRLSEHLELNKLSNSYQSAYKKLHSTESALLKVENDILMNMEKGQVTALVLLDLSAAFDTIDHKILLQRLTAWFGISGEALHWFYSYLKDRSQKVKIKTFFSSSIPLHFGVPQGSVLGPLLFTLYTSPLSKVISDSNVSHHLYADDTQLYISFSTNNAAESLDTLKNSISKISAWMSTSMLKLNPSKTEFLLLGSSKQRDKFSEFFPLSFLDNAIQPANSARNLGVSFDNNMNFKDHISNICKTCFYHIRDLRRIRKHLNLPTAKTIAYSLISSRLDYCNSLLFKISKCDLSKLQRVQNCLARVICKNSRLTPSKPILKKLHWLPISYRIEFKLSTLVFKSFYLKEPSYLSNLLKPVTNSRKLRSSTELSFFVPRVKTLWGQRSFEVAGPHIWNSLPPNVRAAKSLPLFRKLLKTHLFGEAFPT